MSTIALKSPSGTVNLIPDPTGYYAYIHCKPDGSPFYVGKGSSDRLKLYSKRNNYHKNIVNKYGREKILIGGIECSSESIAFELEKGLIKCLTVSGIKLSNLTSGGEGASHSKETKSAISAKLKGTKKAWLSKAMKEAQKSGGYTKGRTLTDDHKEAISKGHIGRKLSKDTKDKISSSHKSKDYITCPNCGISSISRSSMKRWHFDNCKGERIVMARCTIDGKRIYLGRYATKEIADAIVEEYLINYLKGANNE